MIKLIAETAWHHEGDYVFMKDLVNRLCKTPSVDIIKMHITLDFDEYMSQDHEAYNTIKKWLFSKSQWVNLIDTVKASGKELMLLLNDTKSIKFASKYNPDLVELHSVCLNVPKLQQAIIKEMNSKTRIVIGIGGCSLQEVDAAVESFKQREVVLMFGFQNYPTKYADINLKKIRKIQSLYSDKKFGYADHTAWNEDNNELITLLIGSNNMDYIEKHVTTEYGKERCDYSAAISIEMLESLKNKIDLLNSITGDGLISLNSGEQSYSQYGPMKMAGIAANNLTKGKIVTEDDVRFCRTAEITDLSQIELINHLNNPLLKDVKIGDTFKMSHFSERCK